MEQKIESKKLLDFKKKLFDFEMDLEKVISMLERKKIKQK
jgi:hypothetical protein